MNDADERRDEASRAPTVIFALLILAFFVLASALIFGSLPDFSSDRPGAPGSNRTSDAIVTAILLFALAFLVWQVQPSRVRSDDLAGAVPLCPGCLVPYREGAHFCAHCAAPLTWYAATAWYEAVHAQAWCLGRAAHGPSRPIHVVGLGLRFGAEAATLVVILASPSTLFGQQAALYYGLTAVAWLALWGTLLRRCIRNLDSTDPDRLDPERGPYGSPPWWTYDRYWGLTEPESESEAPPSP